MDRVNCLTDLTLPCLVRFHFILVFVHTVPQTINSLMIYMCVYVEWKKSVHITSMFNFFIVISLITHFQLQQNKIHHWRLRFVFMHFNHHHDSNWSNHAKSNQNRLILGPLSFPPPPQPRHSRVLYRYVQTQLEHWLQFKREYHAMTTQGGSERYSHTIYTRHTHAFKLHSIPSIA